MKLIGARSDRSPGSPRSRFAARWMSGLASIAVALGLLVGLPSVAGAEAVSGTIKFDDVTQSFQDVNPCTGSPVTVTMTYDGVIAYAVDAQGGLHLTGTLVGTIEVVPLDPSLPTYTGRFANWFGESTSSNSDGDWVTLNIKLRGSDGSTISVISVIQFHLSNGVLHVAFDTERIRCGS
jgi:hypothetical protein